MSILPIWFLRSVKLNRKRRILISSALSASVVINILTVTQAVVFFHSVTSGSIVFEHVKVACSMIVCNLLVIVALVYRALHKGNTGFHDSRPDASKTIEFTTVDVAQAEFTQETSRGTPLSALKTKSSTWSFRGSSCSKASGSVTAAMSCTLSVARSSEDEAGRSVSMD